jgi:hypothetical protein
MNDLSGAIGLVALIDLLVLAIGIGAFVWWHRRFQPSARAIRAARLGLICGYGISLRWAIVPTYQIPRAILIAAVSGAAVAAAVWFFSKALRRF